MEKKKVKPGRIPEFKKRFNELSEAYENRAAFADMLGLSRQSVNFWLNGDRTPDAESLRIIANKLHVSIDWLLGIPGALRNPDPDVQAAVSYTGLSEKAIENLHFLTNLNDRRVVPALNYVMTNNLPYLLGTLAMISDYCETVDKYKSVEFEKLEEFRNREDIDGSVILSPFNTISYYKLAAQEAFAKLIEKEGDS